MRTWSQGQSDPVICVSDMEGPMKPLQRGFIEQAWISVAGCVRKVHPDISLSARSKPGALSRNRVASARCRVANEG